MHWTTSLFLRETLYAEVWAEPVTTVAIRYGISNVGLRKICRKLGVPLPGRGYWAKVASGKRPRVTPLSATHRGPKAYERRVLVDEQATDRAARSGSLLDSEGPKAWPAISLKSREDELHAVVRRTGQRLGTKSRVQSGLLHCRAHDVFEFRVSESQKLRAQRVIDAILTNMLAAGAALVAGVREKTPVHLSVLGESVTLSIKEEVRRTRREPTREEAARQKREYWYQPDLYVYEATGKLTVVVLGVNRYSPILTVSDGVSQPLERRLEGVVQRIWRRVSGIRVDAELRKEEQSRLKAHWARQEAIDAARAGELERLRRTEQFVQSWRRAQDLRDYAGAMERAGGGPTASMAPHTFEQELEWIRKAADWLDPLVVSPPELVDAVNTQAEDLPSATS